MTKFSWTERSQKPAVRGLRLTVSVLFTRVRPSSRGQSSGSTFPDDCVSFQVGHHCSFVVAAPQPSAEAYGEQAVDDGVQAGVKEPEDEQDVGEGVGDFPLQVVWEEPVPQTQQVVRSPADDEADHDDDAHLQSSHSGFGDVVFGAAEIWLAGGDWRRERAAGFNVRMKCNY